MSRLIVSALHRPRLAGPIGFSLPPGSITGLIGPNGAGKTTLLRALAGLTSGEGAVVVDGRPLAAMRRDERARRLAYMPATRDIDWPLAARDVVALGDPDPERVRRAMLRTGTLDFADRAIDTLSTGERARVLLARAIAGAPQVLLLDEPMANLDPLHRLDIEALLREEAARDTSILVSIHDLDHAARFCDALILMHRGAVIANGSPGAVLTAETLARVFGVSRFDGGWARACDGMAPGL